VLEAQAVQVRLLQELVTQVQIQFLVQLHLLVAVVVQITPVVPAAMAAQAEAVVVTAANLAVQVILHQ
jgi:hypothetical protein